jgi:tetratricopeptide (TPR) repeat protein
MALESEHQESIVTARLVRAVWERWIGHPRKTLELTEGLVEVLRSMYNISALSNVIWIRGTALAELGQIGDALTIFRNGIDLCERFGALYRLGNLYNCIGYCYSEIYQPEQSWIFNRKSEEVSRNLIERYPMGRRQWAHCLGEAIANLVENLLDQGNLEGAWKQLKAIEEESKSSDFDMNRYQWESRTKYLTAQILVHQNNLDQAETIIQDNLKKVRRDLLKKREGSFLRVFGEVQMNRNETDNAITTLNEAIQILQAVENPRQLWQAYDSLASVFAQTGRHSEAMEQWGAASTIIQNTAEALSDRELREGFLKAEPIRKILSKAVTL